MYNKKIKFYLKQKLDKYRFLLRISDELNNSLKKRDYINLEEYLIERDNIIGEIDHLDEVYSDYLKIELEADEEISDLKSNIKEIIEKIQKKDQKNMSLINKIREDIGANLAKIKKGRKVNSGYAANKNTGLLLDKKK